MIKCANITISCVTLDTGPPKAFVGHGANERNEASDDVIIALL